MNIEYFKRNNKIHWNPEIIGRMTALRDEYRLKQSADRTKSQEGESTWQT